MFSEERKDLPKSPRPKTTFSEKLRARSRSLCDSWRFSLLTTVLTCYALFGDDFRLSVTPRRMDSLFNVFSVFCILIFTVEVVAQTLGKQGYFLGFFFVLDVGSTITLFFDLTWIADEIYCAGDGGNALQASRTGRTGARAARTVRIIRLMRLVKLYKTYKAAIEKKDGSKQGNDSHDRGSSILVPGQDGEDALDDMDQEEAADRSNAEKGEKSGGKDKQPSAETRVGKKLSDMTTRRVIVLVLIMLCFMELFEADTYGSTEFPSSASMGTEMIYERWRSWCLGPNASQTADALPWCLQSLDTPSDIYVEERREQREWYEKYLLSYVYSHHRGDFAWNLYWIGINSTSLVQTEGKENAGDYLGKLAQLNHERFLGSRTIDNLNDWNTMFSDPKWEAKHWDLPESVRTKLTQPWIEGCYEYKGVAVTTSIASEYSSVCSIDEELRCQEIELYMPLTQSDPEELHLNMLFVFDVRGTTQVEAGLSILRTIFICCAVGLGAMSFSNNANVLLLNPIERMIGKMETIKDNPLEAMKLGDLEYRREQIEQAKREERLAKKGKCWHLFYSSMSNSKEPMETVILEKTIIKLGGLLALGFGEAGAEIIGQNMNVGHSAGVNAMVPGQKVDAIIGFCNIRNFADATEVLKEKVMVFVNQVGEIVHGCIDDFYGAPNKNIGDSFLIVWRLSGGSPDRQTKLADMAIMSFTRIVAEINKSRVLAVYRGHPGLLQRIRKYRVQMGFGLHCGWAIEGAIGSEFKIDASYLSPNVNVASRLEAATMQFNVWILISHFMINLCSQELAVICRLIDHVTVKGSKQPVRLYTLDLDHLALEVQQKSCDRVVKNRFKMRQIRESRKNEKWADDYHVWEAFGRDADLIKMRAAYSMEFFQRFSMAYRNYEAGEWMVARDMLLTCHYAQSTGDERLVLVEDEWPVDGPTNTLLLFMRQTGYVPPPDWPGHRELSEK